MTFPALGDGEGHLAMAHSAFLTQQDGGHTDVVRAFFGYEYLRMAIRAVKPLRMLFVWIDHVRHGSLDLTHDIEIQHYGLFVWIVTVISRLNGAILERFHPIHTVA